MIKAKLIVVGGDAKRSEVNLKKLPATIGRANEASITLPHALVSRQHCEIYENDNQLFVKDLNSLNGTYLNNQKIQGSASLLPGQLLTLGNVTFRADYSLADAAEIRPTAPANTPPKIASNHVTSAGHDRESPSDDDTDHGGSAPGSDTDNHVFALDDQTSNQPGKSVAFSALANLPSQQPQASFNGNLQLEASPVANHEDEDIKIDLGESAPATRDASQSSLGEFLRKLPK